MTWLISNFMAWQLMYTNSFDSGIWNVYFQKWQEAHKREKRGKKEKGKTENDLDWRL